MKTNAAQSDTAHAQFTFTVENHLRNSAIGRQAETLANFDLFRSLDARAVAEIDRQCIWRHYSHDDWIVEQNDSISDVFFIFSGTVRVKTPSTAGRDVIFTDLKAGDFFGEVSAIDGRPHVTGLVAMTDATIARMSAVTFRRVIHTHSDVCDQVLLRLANKIRSLANRVNEFSTLDVRHRIYAELLRLSRPKSGLGNSAVISPPPVQASIAARISTRREAVAREMKALERAGLLERSRGALLITDTKRLQCMIEKVRAAD